METAQFLWGFKINKHKTTTKVYLPVSPFSALESLPEAQEGGGTTPWLLHKVAPCVLLCVTKGSLWVGLRISHGSTLPEGRQREGEPERKDTCPSRIWVAEGPQSGAGTLHTGAGAQGPSRGCPEKVLERKCKAVSSFPGLGARQPGSGTEHQTLLGLNPSPATYYMRSYYFTHRTSVL